MSFYDAFLLRRRTPHDCTGNGQRFLKAVKYILALCSCGLLLSGCFRPLYGTSVVTGRPMAETLASIDVQQLKLNDEQDYLAHVLHTELVSQLTGHGGTYADTPKRYQLRLSYSGQLRSAHIDQVTSRVDSSVIEGTLTLTLFEGSQQIYQDKVQSFVSFERTTQRYATLRAQRDAYGRLGKTLASQAKTSLALHFASGK